MNLKSSSSFHFFLIPIITVNLMIQKELWGKKKKLSLHCNKGISDLFSLSALRVWTFVPRDTLFQYYHQMAVLFLLLASPFPFLRPLDTSFVVSNTTLSVFYVFSNGSTFLSLSPSPPGKTPKMCWVIRGSTIQSRRPSSQVLPGATF